MQAAAKDFREELSSGRLRNLSARPGRASATYEISSARSLGEENRPRSDGSVLLFYSEGSLGAVTL